MSLGLYVSRVVDAYSNNIVLLGPYLKFHFSRGFW